MSARKLLAVAAITPLLLGVAAADAAPRKPAPKKPTCKLINDRAGDAVAPAAPVPNDPNLDILSADVATDATRLTAVIRVASLSGEGSTSPTGRSYSLVFNAKGTIVSVDGIVGPTGTTWFSGKGTGTVDPAKKEVRIHVPLSALSVPIKPGDKLLDVKAQTWRWVHGTRVVLGNVDTATTATGYTAGWPSCVKVGA